jgi:hypothetical protein
VTAHIPVESGDTSMGFMDNLNDLAKKAQDKIQKAQAKIQEVATQVSSPGVPRDR